MRQFQTVYMAALFAAFAITSIAQAQVDEPIGSGLRDDTTAIRLTDETASEPGTEAILASTEAEFAGYADHGKLDACGVGCDCGSCGYGYGSCWDRVSNIGGELRFRYHDERGMFGGRFSPARYDTLLTRLRLWGDVALTENVTFRMEGIFADSTSNDGFRPIDRNWGDFRGAYFDINLTGDLSAKIGRQDFLYGAQRIVSPLDWANTRRQFDGVKVTYDGLDQWSWDAFFGNVVRVVVDDFDRSNYDASLYGLYGVYKGLDCATLDTYYIGYDNQALGFSRHNVGSRLNGSRDQWLYELEGSFQFGNDNGDSVSDGFATVGAGRKGTHCWNPTLWLYFDYATGAANKTRAGNVGYDEVFPLTHKYLGFIDSVLRSNVIAPNVLFTFEPMEHTKFLLWYYHFRAENDGAIIPGIGNAPQSVGMGNRTLGDELDFLGTFQLTDRSSLLVGYSYFWRGNRITGTNDAQFIYGQYSIKF